MAATKKGKLFVSFTVEQFLAIADRVESRYDEGAMEWGDGVLHHDGDQGKDTIMIFEDGRYVVDYHVHGIDRH